MGGFTSIWLRDNTQENIDQQNAELDALGVAKKYRFYSEKDIETEYEYYLKYKDHPKGDIYYKPEFFPRDEINSLEDFKQIWSPKKFGTNFIPEVGMLTFDCYFGRTSKRAMHGIARFLLYTNERDVFTSGSYSTFVERCGYKAKSKQKVLLAHEKY